MALEGSPSRTCRGVIAGRIGKRSGGARSPSIDRFNLERRIATGLRNSNSWGGVIDPEPVLPDDRFNRPEEL